MFWGRIAARKIREAMSDGQFDGQARRSAVDLDDSFKPPEERRLTYSILKNAGMARLDVAIERAKVSAGRARA